MPKLSPAAEAILDAALPHQVHRYAAAAALRAAADQVENLYCADLVIDDSDGAVFVLRQLMLLAAELEAN